MTDGIDEEGRIIFVGLAAIVTVAMAIVASEIWRSGRNQPCSESVEIIGDHDNASVSCLPGQTLLIEGAGGQARVVACTCQRSSDGGAP